ncbi:MAG: RidA family protein [Firmicutes bacterium]|jgi:2-iminobutanoate/2-iminopropanoate deaminase|nr:RidA family protein [Bacillota bacterium]
MKKIISTDKAPGAIGPYSQAVLVGNMVYTSGQIPVNPETGTFPEDIQEQAKQALENVKAVLAEAGTTLDKVFKTTVFIADMEQFGLINEIYAQYFTSDFPARSCVQVAKLPLGVGLEVEAIAYL